MERKRPKPGEIYTHFKGKRYQVLGLAIHTETEEELVIYKALYGTHGVYARPLDMFLSPVDKDKYPEVKGTYRFELTGRARREAEGGLSDKDHGGDHGEGRADSEEGQSVDHGSIPLICEFLDCSTNEEKLRFLYQHRMEVTDSFLLTAGESLDCVISEKTTELRFEELTNALRMKIKYETGRRR